MSVYPLFSGVLAFDRMGESEGEAGQGVCAHSGMTLGRLVEILAPLGLRLNVQGSYRYARIPLGRSPQPKKTKQKPLG